MPADYDPYEHARADGRSATRRGDGGAAATQRASRVPTAPGGPAATAATAERDDGPSAAATHMPADGGLVRVLWTEATSLRVPTPGAPLACTSARCGGPAHCLHRVGVQRAAARAAAADASEVRRAVYAWCAHALPHVPYADDADGGAVAALQRLVRARADAEDMRRCGVTAEQLAVCNVTLDDLLRSGGGDEGAAGAPLSEVLRATGVHGDDAGNDAAAAAAWQRAHMLRFHVQLLARPDAPLTLMRAPLHMRARQLLEFPVANYAAHMHGKLRLTPHALAALGFDAPLLLHRFGMTAAALLDAPDAHFWLRDMRLSPRLLRARVLTSAVYRDAPPKARVIFVALLAAADAHEAEAAAAAAGGAARAAPLPPPPARP